VVIVNNDVFAQYIIRESKKLNDFVFTPAPKIEFPMSVETLKNNFFPSIADRKGFN